MSNSRNGGPLRHEGELAAEQRYVSMLYGRLDALREEASGRLERALLATGGTPQARSERDSESGMYSGQLRRYSAVENGLCFGRMDFEGGGREYVGRLGLLDEEDGYRPLLMDWRAPAARPFYLATAAAPEGVRMRRHIRTRSREVTELDDEVLDPSSAGLAGEQRLTGEAALMAAMTAARTGRMSDIVATIQAEQDRIISSPLPGVLVVQGGPGTGKTAVALHRVAYLLYTYRQQLERRGVLVVGPNATFLHYIGQVLPSLGETGALLRTPGQLFPGVDARDEETPAVAEVKGRAAMSTVISDAVKDRQRVPRKAVEIVFDREPLVLDRRVCQAARTKARRARRPHNQARLVFRREMIAALGEQVADRFGRELLDPADLTEIATELRADEGVARALEQLWPDIGPQRLVGELLSDPERLARAGQALDTAARRSLLRDAGAAFTPADVPLLDEAAELLGEDDSADTVEQQRREQAELDYAQGVLDILDLPDHADPELLLAADVLSAQRLAERHSDEERQTAAERAAADRTWTFGHVIVDEAQELSPMAWRTIMRRCPSRSMTLVGDIAQTGDLAGATSWAEVLRPYVGERWRSAQLTVNYRTPAEIMDIAGDVLAELDPEAQSPTSVRESGVPPWARHLGAGEIVDRCSEVVRAELEQMGARRLAVLAPAALAGRLAAALGSDTDGTLDAQVSVLRVEQAKGLEFDSVLVVDPVGMLAKSAHGGNDLYVALTRATQRLGVLHTGELPEPLRRLEVAPAGIQQAQYPS